MNGLPRQRREGCDHDEAWHVPRRHRAPCRRLARSRRRSERPPIAGQLPRHRAACGARQVRSAVHGRYQRHVRRRRRGVVDPHDASIAARADHTSGRHRRRHRTHRSRSHRDHHLFRAVPRRAVVRFAGPDQRRPCRLESGDLARRGGGLQFRQRGAPASRRPLRASARIRQSGARPVGQLRRRRRHRRQAKRHLSRSLETAFPQPQRQTFLGARAVDRAPLAAGPSGDRAGRPVRRRPRPRRRNRRNHVHGAAGFRGGQGVLRRHQAPRRRLRPPAQRHQGDARRDDRDRPHPRRSGRKIRALAGAAVAGTGDQGFVVAFRFRSVDLSARRAGARSAIPTSSRRAASRSWSSWRAARI